MSKASAAVRADPTKFREWFKGPPRRTQEQLVEMLAAKGVEVTQQSISRWASGADVPGDDKFPALTECTGLYPWDFWPAERADRMRALVADKPVVPSEAA